MANFTSITIRRKSTRLWVFIDNTMPVGSVGRAASFNSATINNTLMTFATKTGGVLYNEEPVTVFNYIDETDSSKNYTPTNAAAFMQYLFDQDFFGVSGGGTGDIPAIYELADSLIGSLIGRQNQSFVVDPSGIGFTTKVINSVSIFQDLLNVPDFMPPGKLVMTSNFTTGSTPPFQSFGIIFVDPDTYINTPIPSQFLRLLSKGYIYDGTNYIPNEENFLAEAGDFFNGYKLDEITNIMYFYPLTRWTGTGDVQDIENHIYNNKVKLTFMGEPGHES